MAKDNVTQVVDEESVEQTIGGMPSETLVSQSLAVALNRGEIDQAIMTARAMPRKITRALSNIKTLATLSERAADECIYAVPRGGKTIRGPSIRFAEIVVSQWGNCRVGAREVHIDRIERRVYAEGVFHDLETNVYTTARVGRIIQAKKGRGIDDDMIQLAIAAACSIAKRNAILAGVPRAVWIDGYEAVEEVLRGDVKTLAERRDAMLKAFGVLGVAPDRVFAAIEVSGVDDINLDHLVSLKGMYQTVKRGERSIDEMFPAPAPAKGEPGAAKSAEDRLRDLAKDEMPAHDPETGEIVDEKQKPADEPAKEPAPNAAAPTAAPDPAAAAAGAPSSASPTAESKGAPAKGESKKGARKGAPEGAKPEPARTKADERRAVVAETGAARAEAGEAALNDYLDDIDPDDQPYATTALRQGWRKRAKEVDASRARKPA